MQDKCLPFPRGSTYGDFGGITMTATYADHIEGRIFEVEDTVHNTGQKIKLRAVRNSTGAAITVARDLCEFRRTTALDFGRKIANFGAALSGQGVVCKPLDDAYTLADSIPANDLFYVVEAGDCTVVTETGVVSLPIGTAVAANAAGGIDGARAAAGFYVIGTMNQDCFLASTNVVVHVNEGLDNASA